MAFTRATFSTPRANSPASTALMTSTVAWLKGEATPMARPRRTT